MFNAFKYLDDELQHDGMNVGNIFNLENPLRSNQFWTCDRPFTHFHAPNRKYPPNPSLPPLFCWPWVYHRDWPSNVGNGVGQRGGIRGTSQKTLRWAIHVGQPNLELRHEALQVHQMRGEQRFPKQVVEIHGESAISASVNLNGSVCGRQYTIYFLGGAQIVVYIYIYMQVYMYVDMYTCAVLESNF